MGFLGELFPKRKPDVLAQELRDTRKVAKKAYRIRRKARGLHDTIRKYATTETPPPDRVYDDLSTQYSQAIIMFDNISEREKRIEQEYNKQIAERERNKKKKKKK